MGQQETHLYIQMHTANKYEFTFLFSAVVLKYYSIYLKKIVKCFYAVLIILLLILIIPNYEKFVINLKLISLNLYISFICKGCDITENYEH